MVDGAPTGLESGQERVAIDVRHTLPLVQTDPTLLGRVWTGSHTRRRPD